MDCLEDGVCVGTSHCGMGLFSTRSFRTHELIGPIRGVFMTDPQYESDYCMEMGDNGALEPDAPYRFVNHSCHPNCEIVEVEVDGVEPLASRIHLWFEALAEISSGEEITIDYAWPARVAIPCRCGAVECRGWIVSEDQLGLLT